MWDCHNCEPLYGTCSCLDWTPLKEEDDELLLGKMGFLEATITVSSLLSLHKYYPSNSWGMLGLKNIVSSWEIEQENTSEKLFGTSVLSLCLGRRSNVTLVHCYYFFNTCRRKNMGNLASFLICVLWLKEGTCLICNLLRGSIAILINKRNGISSEVAELPHNTITGAT